MDIALNRGQLGSAKPPTREDRTTRAARTNLRGRPLRRARGPNRDLCMIIAGEAENSRSAAHCATVPGKRGNVRRRLTRMTWPPPDTLDSTLVFRGEPVPSKCEVGDFAFHPRFPRAKLLEK